MPNRQYHHRHHPPNAPRLVESTSMQKRRLPHKRVQQKHDFDERPESDFRVPCSSFMNNTTALIGVIVSLLEVVIILIIAWSGSIIFAAILLALHIGGTKAAEIVFNVLKLKGS